MAHAALTQIDGEAHHHDVRLSRGALGLAGQASQPFRVWLEDWAINGGVGGGFPWRIKVAGTDFALDLTLAPERAPLLQGNAGLSQKSAEPGNASYYYSITRLATSGSVVRAGEAVAVTGRSWLDREWSTSALGADQVGWDWFSLQLDSGDDLMLYRLRTQDGQTDPHSAGKILTVDDRVVSLKPADYGLEALRWWTSPRGARYPVEWRLQVPEADLDLRVSALLDDQEMDTGILYWEGAVEVRDATAGTSVGQGYLEMTGYDAGDQ
jgi:predicted secreted hydrolase